MSLFATTTIIEEGRTFGYRLYFEKDKKEKLVNTMCHFFLLQS